MLRYRPCFLLLLVVLSPVSSPLFAQGTAEDYERSSKLYARTRNKVFHDRVVPHWLADNRRFWYRNDLPGGKREYILVDATTGEPDRAFDGARLAAALSRETQTEQKGESLNLDDLDFSSDGKEMRFRMGEKSWKCNLQTYKLTADPKPGAFPKAARPERDSERRRQGGQSPRITSPDNKWSVFLKENNLYVRDKASGKEHVLSEDGAADDSYSDRVIWSPDSKKLVALRSKKGQEHKVYLIESSPRFQLQPRLQSFDYYKPGDRIPITKPHLFDVTAHKEIPVKDELFPTPWPFGDFDVRWSPDSKRFTFVYNQRGHQVLRVIAVDAESGDARAIIDEQSKTFIDYAHKFFAHYLDSTNEMIWMSERDGWNHLYLIDAVKGRVKKQITQGPWVVRGVDRVDEQTREIWFRAGG